jgi:drug/metabolite transporter (DMT)-like permease
VLLTRLGVPKLWCDDPDRLWAYMRYFVEPLTLWLAPADLTAVPARSWTAFAYVTLMSQYVGFFAWNAGLALGGVTRVSQVQLLQTFVTLLIAAALNGERVDALTWAVAVLVVALVVIGRQSRIRRTEPLSRTGERQG